MSPSTADPPSSSDGEEASLVTVPLLVVVMGTFSLKIQLE